MAIIAFNYLKFDSEKTKGASATGEIEVKHNLSISDVKKAPLQLAGNATDVLRIEFVFDIKYSGDLGRITITGEVIYTDTKEIIEETFKTWEASKELNLTVKSEVHKFVYNKSIIKSISLADDLGLPAPVPMPKFKYADAVEKK